MEGRTSNAQDCAIVELCRDRVLDLLVGFIVNRCGRFIENEDLGIVDYRASEADEGSL